MRQFIGGESKRCQCWWVKSTTQGLLPDAAMSVSHHRPAPEYAAPPTAFEIPPSSIPPQLESPPIPQHPPPQPPTPQVPTTTSTTGSPAQPDPPPAPPPTPKRTSSRATTTKMEANINKILDNHLHQITAAFQSSLHASPAPRPPAPVPDPDPPQPIPPSSSHGAPPSRPHRTTTPTLWHRRSRSPRHSRHRSQHRHQLPALCDPELTARNIAAHQAQTDVAPPVVILHFVVVISLVKPSRHHRKLYTSKALCHAAHHTLARPRCGSVRRNILILPNLFRLHLLVAHWLHFHHLPLLHRILTHPPAIASLFWSCTSSRWQHG